MENVHSDVTVERVNNIFASSISQVIKQASSSAVKSFLFNLAMRFKKAELER